MRIKDLHGTEGFIWPPEWATRLEGCNGGWILSEVKLQKEQDPPYIYIEAVCNNDAQEGIIHLAPREHLEILYQVLNKNIGKSLTEIGELKITF
ncbi:MAG: hypothetical protein ACLQUW_05880 [Desulfobaccales bacterium]